MFDCCLETDGAAAVVVTSAERAKDRKQRPVYIMGAAAAHPYPADEITNREDIFRTGLTDAAPKAFAIAGRDARATSTLPRSTTASPSRCFSKSRRPDSASEAKVAHSLRDGRIEIGGEVPVNTHGGLLSEAHVLGMSHIVEAARQLRGNLGKRQVKGRGDRRRDRLGRLRRRQYRDPTEMTPERRPARQQ